MSFQLDLKLLFSLRDKISLKYFRYQSTLLGSYQTVELIETFMNYQVMDYRLGVMTYD